MMMSNNGEERYCKVVGLKSAEGLKRNGSAAKVVLPSSTLESSAEKEIRLPVAVDGFPGPMSIKMSNLSMMPRKGERKFKILTVGVGRGTLLDTTFKTVLADDSQVLSGDIILGTSARSRGNMLAMEMFVKKHARQIQRSNNSVMLSLTDLNIARAFNRVAMGIETKLAPPLNKQFQRISKSFPVNCNNNQKVIVKFDSHRISADGLKFPTKKEKLGPRRYNSVKNGTFHIYPCALKQYLDALEVRYVYVKQSAKESIINHDIYLDYGLEEAQTYPKHAVAMGEGERLSPAILAEVDPQMFWAAVLWYKEFMVALELLVDVPNNVMEEWKELAAGIEKAREEFNSKLNPTDKALSLGPDKNWGIIKSADQHIRVATDHAIAAINVISCCIKPGQDSIIHTQDFYKGTEIDKYIFGLQKFLGLSRDDFQKNGEKPSIERTEKLYGKAMKSVGLGRDSRLGSLDPLDACANCGKRSKKRLQTCARCDGVAYCDSNCQKAHWKEHRGNCSRVYVQLSKKLDNIELMGGKVEVSHYQPNSSLASQPTRYSEVSGIGMMTIFWNPGAMSSLSFPSFDQSSAHLNEISCMLSPAGGSGNPLENIYFQTLSSLQPIVRFVITCGPLSDLDTAKASLQDALDLACGNLENIRAPKVGFTALEWAAKKGNRETVRWLCTDERTKAMINIGCPIGWAAYTGQVDIMRDLIGFGADPNKTDAVLWGRLPPLLVAAQNGQLDAMKFLVDECNQDIKMCDSSGRDIIGNIKDSPNWRDNEDHVSAHKWAKKRLNKKK